MSEETVFKNEQMVYSPLPNWPGHVVLPVELDSEQFCAWWENDRTAEKDDSLPDEVKAFRNRAHFLLDFKLGPLSPDNFNPAVDKLPSMELAMWVIGLTQPLLLRARSVPNLQRPSSDTTPSTAQS